MDSGMADFKLNINEQVINAINSGISSGLKHWAQEVMEKSLEICPVRTGYLKSTGHIIYKGDKTVAFTYDAPYAIFIHEGLNGHHPRKFLENPLMESTNELPAIIKKEIGL